MSKSHENNVVNIPNDIKAKVLAAAKEYFGTTSLMEFAGYLTTDGDFLDFRGDVVHSRQRDIDHRDISDAFEEYLSEDDIATIAAICLKQSQYNGAMDFFMNCGNIRLSIRGIDLIKEPNEVQYSKLYDFLEDLARSERIISIDFSDETGKIIGAVNYNMEHVSVMTLINDIKDYYRTHELPENKGFLLENETALELD